MIHHGGKVGKAGKTLAIKSSSTDVKKQSWQEFSKTQREKTLI